MPSRNLSIDNAKFLLITLVVLGHVFEINTGYNVISEKIYTFIYSFHMPAFILISGYFFSDKDITKFWRRIMNLVCLYLVFQILVCGNPLKYSGWNSDGWFLIDGAKNNLTHFYNPAGALWYIVSLIFWRIILHSIPIKFRDKSAKTLLLISIFCAILAGYIPVSKDLSFQRTFAFFPYFIIGFIFRQHNGFDRLANIDKRIACGIATIYAIAIALIPHIPLSMLVQFYDYYQFGNPVISLLVRIISYIWMLPITLAVLCIMSNWTRFAKYGADSLFFYVYHMFGVGIVRLVMLSNGASYGFIPVFLSFVILMIALIALSHCRILYKPFEIYSSIERLVKRKNSVGA
jgi:fucose 4-O-acetylase-like acetyltransferase